MASLMPVGLQSGFENALAHLPISTITEYCRGQMIFGPGNPSRCFHMVVTGKIGLTHIGAGGNEVLLEIVLPDELFGESSILNVPHQSECATALGKATVMSWTAPDIEDLVMKRPRLGVALLQLLAQRNVECNRRIASLSLDTIERRLARALVRFSERMGVAEEDGSVQMMALTHEMLSRYVGTSREVITTCMNRFRKQGFLRYSRQGIIFHRDSLKTVLNAASPAPNGSAS